MTNGIKKTFLTVYDYGMGGVWVLIDARTPDEIESLHPELRVAQSRPQWLTDEVWVRIDTNHHFDIDVDPNGWLAELVGGRGIQANRS